MLRTVIRSMGGLIWPRTEHSSPTRTETGSTIFHITHAKAGSQWINRLFHLVAYEQSVFADQELSQFFQQPVQPGRIYPTLYITKQEFDSVAKPANHRRFVIIRDLRDTLVSGYFSLRYSHPLSGNVSEWRERLVRQSLEDGLLSVMENWLSRQAQIQWSWVSAREPLIRYEELLERDFELLEQILIRRCRLRVAPEKFRAAVEATRFEAWTQGRKRGVEEQTSHERKGIAGDWKNQFTAKLKRVFKQEFGSVLIATGYESDFNW
jgi:lipopolysaccharide transport system ATP-binding protein